MFLALSEMKMNKRKYWLIITLVSLITYLVYFLTALAYGLASSYTNGINRIGANHILLSNQANDNIMMSVLNENDFNSINVTNAKAKLGVFPAVFLNSNEADIKLDAYMFGIDDFNFFFDNGDVKLNQ